MIPVHLRFMLIFLNQLLGKTNYTYMEINQKIFKTLIDIEFYEDKKYFDWLADKNPDPLFTLKDENDSRFGTGIQG